MGGRSTSDRPLGVRAASSAQELDTVIPESSAHALFTVGEYRFKKVQEVLPKSPLNLGPLCRIVLIRKTRLDCTDTAEYLQAFCSPVLKHMQL